MTDRVEVDPAALDTAAGKAEAIAGKIQEIGRTLRSGLDPLEDDPNKTPYGSDKMGVKFVDGENGQNGYYPARNGNLEGIDSFVTTFNELGKGQRDAAKTIRDTDSA